MSNYKKFTLSASFLLLLNLSFSQIPIGEWRTHFAFNNASCVADAGDKVYVAAELAVFSFDKDEGTVEKLTKVEAYSDCDIQTIAYNKSNNVLIIAYQNSNIDLIKNNTIYNFSEIKRKQITTDKTIYKITFIDKIAYLSCGFGIVLLDTENLEFSDTYFIGDNASYIKVNDITTDESYIYAATDVGLLQADKNSQNLSDYRNWYLNPNIPNNNYIFNEVENFNGIIFANQIHPILGNDTLLFYKNNSWNYFQEGIDNLKSVTSTESNIVLTQKSIVKVFDKNLNLIKSLNWYSFLNDNITTWPSMNYAVVDDSGEFWIADSRYGLVYKESNVTGFIYPDGTYNNSTAKIEIVEGKVIATNGSNKAWYSPIYNVFKKESWETYTLNLDTARNFYSIAVDNLDSDHVFIGSYGYGIFEFLNDEWIASYNHTNSTVQAIDGYSYGYIRISSMAFDRNNNLWIANQLVGEPISVRTPDNEWLSFNFEGQITNYEVEDIFVSENNLKWILLGKSKGFLVFDDNNTPLDKDDDTFKRINPTTVEGEVISNSVYSIEEDKDGNIWIGTDEGVCIYYNQEDVFTDNFFTDRIQLTSIGNDTTEQYLLSTDIVTDIETDGANRKWIATQNSGLFLVSENGKEEILKFNSYNSPLISNAIKDIAIDHKSGEVFIMTDKGVMSYRSDATKGVDLFGDVYVFPNPIRPGYEGKITVTGLADNVNVKITDITGNVVYETNSLGGQAIWDGKTFTGRKVNTGIYLVFCTTDDGSQTYVTKFLFIN